MGWASTAALRDLGVDEVLGGSGYHRDGLMTVEKVMVVMAGSCGKAGERAVKVESVRAGVE